MNELSRMEVRADDIIQYGYIAVKQFPKSEKFVLATRITDLMWEMAALISSAIDAQYNSDKIRLMKEADKELRKLMRIPKDKWLHFCVALVISLFHPLIAVVLSVLKELFDFIRYGWRTQGFWRMAVGDLIADGVGILIGGTVWILLTVL